MNGLEFAGFLLLIGSPWILTAVVWIWVIRLFVK
jgi:hypothetical protein